MNDTNQEKRYYAPAARSGEKRVFFIALILISAVILGVFAWIEYQQTQPQKIEALVKMNTMVRRGDCRVTFAYFDGTEGKIWEGSHEAQEIEKLRELMDSLSKTKGKRVPYSIGMCEKVLDQYPVYSLYVANVAGEQVHIIWTNGYLLVGSDRIYSCDIDFSDFVLASDAYFTSYPLETVKGHAMFRPLAVFWSWNKDYLQESTILGPEIEDIRVEMGYYDPYNNPEAGVRVEMISENDDHPRYYDKAYVQIRLDGVWYDVPLDMFRSGISSGGGIYQYLPKGEMVSVSYDITRYGLFATDSEEQRRLVIPVLTDEMSGFIFCEF